jgi:preprotein translocase subunit SecB
LQNQPQVEVEVTTSARTMSEGQYEVCLIVRGQASADDATFFIVELTYGGVITLANVPEEAIEPVLLIEGARLLFPFARNIVAEVTRDGGFPPLFLAPIDFVQLYQQQHLGEQEDGAEKVEEA